MEQEATTDSTAPAPLQNYSPEDAATYLSVSTSTINNWVRDLKVPAEDDGTILSTTVDEIEKIRAEHPGNWSKWWEKCSWEATLGPAREERQVQLERDADSDVEDQTESMPNMAQRLAARAEALRAEGKHEMACELYGVLVTSLDLSGV